MAAGGVCQFVAMVAAKPDPNTKGAKAYYSLDLIDMGYQMRADVTAEVFHRVEADGATRYVFTGSCVPVRAMGPGDKFSREYLRFSFDRVKPHEAGAAAPAAAEAAPAAAAPGGAAKPQAVPGPAQK